jgi:hypothetical protein
MSKHNFFVKFLKKINLFINSLLEKKLNKLNFLFETDKLLTFFSFKRITVPIIVFLTIVFSYLFIPYTYNSNKLAAKIQNQLFRDLGINLNLSNNFTYNLFPKPNFVFKEIEFINEKKKFADIQEMITYVSFKNLFSVNKINIENIVLNKVNFNLNKNNYKFFSNILNKNFSNFDFEIINSKIIFKNIKNDVLFINKIIQLKYFFDSKDKKNTLTTSNEIFNIPYSVELKDYPVKKKIISKINFDYIKLQIQNEFTYDKSLKNGLVKFDHNKDKSEISYQIEKNFLNFIFLDNSPNKNFSYEGNINFIPFFSEIFGDIKEMNINQLFNSDTFFVQLLKTELLNNKNLNINVTIKAEQITSYNDLNNFILNFKIKEGLVDINKSKFKWLDYVDFQISDSLLYTKDNNLVLDGNILIYVYDVNEFYKFFQTPRNYRKEIKEIRFNFVYNFDQKISNLNNIEIDGNNNQKINQVLNQIIFKETFLQNRVYLKNLINKAIKFYAG